MSTDDTDTRTLEEQLSQCDGATCQCGAYGRHECACNADWTPAEVYLLRAELDAMRARIKGAPIGYWSTVGEPLSAETISFIGPCSKDKRVALVLLGDDE